LLSQQSIQSVAQLTKLLQSELSDLSQQDDALRKLARGLGHLLRTLPKDGDGGVLGTRVRESLTPLVQTPERSRRKVNNFLAFGSKPSATNSRIRRACRIALMEADEAGTVDEIYLRIVQRESFHFDNVHQAAAAIRRTLNLMTEQGEALVVDTDPCLRWKRTNDMELR
jgi:hypothetical protein